MHNTVSDSMPEPQQTREDSPSPGLILDRRVVERTNLAASIELEEPSPEEIGYLARVFCQTSLPYRNPGPDVPVWERTNGDLKIEVRPESVTHTDPKTGHKTYAFQHAYGVIPRLFLPWLNSELMKPHSDAVDHETRKVELGDSLADFLRQIGVESATGGTNGSLTRVRQQLRALAASSITVTFRGRAEWDERYDVETRMKATIADRTFFAWARHDPMGTKALIRPHIVLSEQMYRLMKDHPVPLDTRALALLRTHGGGGLALDIYTWLVYRLFLLKKPYLVPWSHLAVQFGSQYARSRDFKHEFVKQLNGPVRLAYPGARFEVQDAGLLLIPSRPAVPTKPRRRPRAITNG